MPRYRKKLRRYARPPQYIGGGKLGKLIGTGVGAVGGSFLGQPMLGAQLGGMAGGALGSELDQPEEVNPTRYASTSYGSNYAFGGKITTNNQADMLIMQNGGSIPGVTPMRGGAKKYSGPKHEQGGVPVDNQGNPTSPQTATAEVEGGETEQDGYIFSDSLEVPKTDGRTFAEVHELLLQQGAGEGEIQKLAQLQEKVQAQEGVQGGDEQPMPEGEPRPNDAGSMTQRAQKVANKGATGRNAGQSVQYRRGQGQRVAPPQMRYGGEYQNGGWLDWMKGGKQPPTRGPANYYVNPRGGASSYMPNSSGSLKGRPNLKQLTGSRPPAKTPGTGWSKPLNTITSKTWGRRMFGKLTPARVGGAAAIGVPLGIAAGEYITGESLGGSFNEMTENWDNLDEAEKRRIQAEQRTQEIRENRANIPEQGLPGLGGPERQADPGVAGLYQGTSMSPKMTRGEEENPFIRNQRDLEFYRSLTPEQKKQVDKQAEQAQEAQQGGGNASPQQVAKQPQAPVDRGENIGQASLSNPNPALTDMGAEPVSAPVDQSGSNIPEASLNQGEVGSTEASGALATGKVGGGEGANASAGGTNWMNVATQVAPSLMKAGLALGSDKPEKTPRVEAETVPVQSSAFNQGKRDLASNYRAILKDPNATQNQKLAAQAQYLQSRSNLAGKEANFRTQQQQFNAQQQSRADRINTQSFQQDREIQAREEGARRSLMMDAVTSPINQYRRDQSMKRNQVANAMISADRISDPVERKLAIQRKLRAIGLSDQEIQRIIRERG